MRVPTRDGRGALRSCGTNDPRVADLVAAVVRQLRAEMRWDLLAEVTSTPPRASLAAVYEAHADLVDPATIGRTRAPRDLYVFRNPLTGLVKIGVARDVAARRRMIECAAGMAIEVAAIFVGMGDREAEVHLRFASQRRLGEWFAVDAQAVASYLEARA